MVCWWRSGAGLMIYLVRAGLTSVLGLRCGARNDNMLVSRYEVFTIQGGQTSKANPDSRLRICWASREHGGSKKQYVGMMDEL